MFTGLVQFLSEVAEVVEERPGKRLVLREPRFAASANVGDSVALNGCCLTIVAVDGERVSFQAGEETLSRTNLGELVRGHRVNVELPLKAGEPIGGHLVTGHIDAVGTVASRSDNGDWSTMWFHAPTALLVQMASKGSIAIDGVSLTLVEVDKDRFSAALIPHTLAVTTLGQRNVGDRVNLETDILAKYVEKVVNASLKACDAE
jgi:riboflavin synthase